MIKDVVAQITQIRSVGFPALALTAAVLLAVPAVILTVRLRRRYQGKHRGRGIETAPAFSLLEHLLSTAPEALAAADAGVLSVRTLEYAAARLPATDILLLQLIDDEVYIFHARGRVKLYSGKRFSISQEIKHRLREEKALVFPDLKHPDYGDLRADFPAVLAEAGVRAVLLVPVDDVRVLAMGSNRPRIFLADDIALLKSASAQLNFFIKTQRRLGETEAKLDEQSRSMGFIDDLVKAETSAPVVEEVLTWAVEALQAAGGTFMVLDRKRGVLNVIAAVGLDERERRASIKVGDGIAGWVAKSKKPIVVEPLPGEVGTGRETAYSAHFPITVKGEVRAVVNLVFPPTAVRFGPDLTARVQQTIGRVMSLAEPLGLADEVWDVHMATLAALAELAEGREPWRRGHSNRVRELALVIGEQLHLDRNQLRDLEIASLLHTFGYLTIDPSLLHAARRLDRHEQAAIRNHAVAAADSLSSAPDMAGVIPIIKYHHESFDGSGYLGLAGEQIPLGARILAVADAYLAMLSPRPHRPSIGKPEAVRELSHQAGAGFDPRVVEIALATVEHRFTA